MDDRTSNTLSLSGFTPYAQVPVWIVRAGDTLSANARCVYSIIMSYADNTTKAAFPSRETLAADLGTSVATIKRATKELEEYGALIVERRRNKRTGNFYANHYTLVFNQPESPWVTGDPRREVTSDPITTPTTTTTPTALPPRTSGPSRSSLRSPSTSGGRSALLAMTRAIATATPASDEQDEAADTFLDAFQDQHGTAAEFWDKGWAERLVQLVDKHGLDYGSAKWLSIFTNASAG